MLGDAEALDFLLFDVSRRLMATLVVSCRLMATFAFLRKIVIYFAARKAITAAGFRVPRVGRVSRRASKEGERARE